jgi:hypothetical protein
MANVTSYRASGDLPPGLGCGAVIGKGLACSASGLVTISYPVLNKSSTLREYMKYNLSSQINYVLPPFSFSGITAGNNFTGRSNSVAIPAGFLVSKQFTPSQVFGGMNSMATVTATNSGPLNAYNATVGSTADFFDTVASTAVLSKAAATIAPHSNASVSYDVAVQQLSGALTASPGTATFYFGGTPFSVQGATTKLVVNQPLWVSVKTTPASPVEGRNFTISIVVTNPAAVAVSNVVFTLPVPSGLVPSNLFNAKLSAGVITLSASSLGPHGNLTATARATASSGITVPFSSAKLSFSYAGATISGTVPRSSGIAIAEDTTARYVVPTVFIILAAFAVAFYIRRKASTVRASQS